MQRRLQKCVKNCYCWRRDARRDAQGHAQKQIINCKNAFNVWQIYLLLINAFLHFFFYGVYFSIFFVKIFILFVNLYLLFLIPPKTYIKCTNTNCKAYITTNSFYGVAMKIKHIKYYQKQKNIVMNVAPGK